MLVLPIKKKWFDMIISGVKKEEYRENKPSRILSKGYNYNNFSDYDECFNECYYKLEEIVVLQVMLCGDNQYLVEAIDKKDYDEIFNNLGSKVK